MKPEDSSQATRELCRLHLDTGYERDAVGRLLRVNEHSVVNAVPPPPLVVLLRSADANLWALRADIDPRLRGALEEVLCQEPIAQSGEAPPHCRDALLRLVAQHYVVHGESAGPLFRFPRQLSAPVSAVDVTNANAELLRRHFPDVLADLAFSEPCVALLDAGAAVSVCFSARRGAEADAAGVVTIPRARGHGYAAAVTAAWARAVHSLGKTPLYGTDWENHASRAVARRLGLVKFATEWSVSDAPVRAKNHP